MFDTERPMMQRQSTNMTEAQHRAIHHLHGPMVVTAGPGSGKTTVIINRLLYLLAECKIPASKILVITFTRAAAEEMRERLRGKMECAYENPIPRIERPVAKDEPVMPIIRTFHAAFYEILRKETGAGLALVEEQEALSWVASFLQEGLHYVHEEALYKAEILLSEYSRYRNTGIFRQEVVDRHFDGDGNSIQEVIQYYQEQKSLTGKIDFDDMMVQLENLFVSRPDILVRYQNEFGYILVDEFQDINSIQYRLITRLAATHHNLFIVGDDDQAIYGFRGASPGFMLQFPKDFPEAKRVDLSVNFRCGSHIMEASSRLIAHNGTRFQKQLAAANPGGDIVCERHVSETAEAAWICREIGALGTGNDIAILCRTRSQFGVLLKSLRLHGIAADVEGEIDTFYSEMEQDLTAYVQWALGSNEEEILARVRPLVKGTDLAGDMVFRDPERNMAAEEMAWHREKLRKMQPADALVYIWRTLGFKRAMQFRQERDYLRWQDVRSAFENLVIEARDYKSLEDWLLRSERVARSSVHLMTMHGAKGLEFDAVFIPSLNEGRVPHRKAVNFDALEEERRILYVAMTRARKKLYLSWVRRWKRSRFLEEI